MKKNKYYFPSIEEFYVGFEFEFLYKNKWHKKTLEFEDFSVLKCKNINDKIILEPELKFRVKYLDKKNFEELDFIFNKKQGLYISKKTFLGVSTGDDKKLCIYYNFEDRSIIIFFRTNSGYETTMFEGFIKNKSELKKMLSSYLKILNE